MIAFETLRLEIHGLDAAELERWIGDALVRAEGEPGAWQFHEIDVARIRLILELRQEFEVEEHSLPVVLSLLDQLYDLRRRTARLNEALGELPVEIRSVLLKKLG
jgi:chaperone modulatory protein CbpM